MWCQQYPPAHVVRPLATVADLLHVLYEDARHALTLHEAGQALHVVPAVTLVGQLARLYLPPQGRGLGEGRCHDDQ